MASPDLPPSSNTVWQTRRHFFRDCAVGLGSIALADMLNGRTADADVPHAGQSPLSPKPTHFPAKAKRVIYLFMAGGPSQLELFDYKPKLQELDGQVVPESYVKNKRFAFIKLDAKLLGTRRKFARYGECGAELSELVPGLASIVDDVAIVRSMATDVFNHGPAKLFANTGVPRFGLPSMGAWVTYGIGSESQDLPGFVVLQSGPRGPRGGAPLWGSGFLPTTYQGVPLLQGPEPILNLASPSGFDGQRQGEFFAAVKDLNRQRLDAVGDPEIATRIAAYEMAWRMQSSAPELMDLSGETAETLAAYGAEPGKPSFANNCLLARRLVERGVRFVQLYHTDWDHHGNNDTHLGKPLEDRCRETDGPAAALVKDLKQRGLLDETLVDLGRGVRPHSDGRAARPDGSRPSHRRIYRLAGGWRHQTRPDDRHDRRARLLRRRRPRSRPRLAGHDLAPTRPRPHEAHLPIPGPQLPPHRRRRKRRHQTSRLRTLFTGRR